MNSLYLLRIFGYFILTSNILMNQQVSCQKPVEDEHVQVIKDGEQPVIPDWVKQTLGESYSDESQASTSTTKKPQGLGDVIGQGLQGILQGIVRAPSDIANRVQEIVDGILRRTSTPPPTDKAATTLSPKPVFGSKKD